MRTKTIDGDKLREARDDLGLTQVELAAKLSEDLGRRVDPTTVSKWENEKVQPGSKAWLALGRALEVDSNTLLKGSPRVTAVIGPVSA